MNNLEQELTLRELIGLLRRALPAMMLAAVLCCGGLFGVAKFALTPMYASTAAVYILPASGEKEDFDLALDMTQDCAYLMTGRTVLEEVIEQEGLDLTWKQLKNRVSIQNPADSRVLEVTVRMESGEWARAVADAVCRAGSEQVTQVLGETHLRQIEPASLEREPCNTVPAAAYLLAALAGAGLVYGGALIRRLYWK